MTGKISVGIVIVVLLLIIAFLSGGQYFGQGAKEDKEAAKQQIQQALDMVEGLVKTVVTNNGTSPSTESPSGGSTVQQSGRGIPFGEKITREKFGNSFFENLAEADKAFYRQITRPPDGFSVVVMKLIKVRPDGTTRPFGDLSVSIGHPHALSPKPIIRPRTYEADSEGRIWFHWPQNQPFTIKNWDELVQEPFAIFDKPGGDISRLNPHYVRERVLFIKREVKVLPQEAPATTTLVNAKKPPVTISARPREIYH